MKGRSQALAAEIQPCSLCKQLLDDLCVASDHRYVKRCSHALVAEVRISSLCENTSNSLHIAF
jgi:cytidine deaminase